MLSDIIAEKYKILFKQALVDLERVAENMPILDEELTGQKNVKKINVRNYIIFYKVNKESKRASVIRIGYTMMDWERYLKNL